MIDMPIPSYQTRATAAQRFITQFAFRSRVSDQIVAAMELEAAHDPLDDLATQQAKAVSRARMARAFSAQWLDLDAAELRAGFSGVSEADFARIFLAPVRDEERP